MGRRGRNNLIGEHFFFVTTTVVRFLPIFSNSSFCDILINNIKYYREKFHFDVLGFVIMPSHFHWIVEVNPKYGTISDIMRDIKKHTAWQIFDELDKQGETKYNKIFREEAAGYKDQERKLWMKRFDDEAIRNQRMFWVKLNYIHNNPVEARFVRRPENYKYSSARNYAYNDHRILKVNTVMGGVQMV